MTLFAAVSAALITGCSAPKKVPYLVDAENIPTEVLSQLPVQTEPIITVGDLLNIDVTSSNMVAVAPLTKVVMSMKTAASTVWQTRPRKLEAPEVTRC